MDAPGEWDPHLIPSHDPDVSGQDSACSRRGLSWLILTDVAAGGMERDGHRATAARSVADSLALFEVGGSSEHRDPMTGAPRGGPAFPWKGRCGVKS